MNSVSDNQLMFSVKKGNLDHLGLLFERYHRILFRFFYNYNQNVELSEDLVQNVFVRILKYRHRFKGTGEFKSWMFHIARNVQFDHYRKKRIKATDRVEDWEEQLTDSSTDFTQEMIKREEYQRLQKAIQKLPSDKREVLVLSKLQGKKYKEIGELLGCTEGAVKVKVFRALKALKEVYEAIGE